MKISWFPNRRAFETHLPSYDFSMPFNLRWTLIGLSSYVDTATMFADLGYANLAISTLADVNQLFFENVPARSKFTAVDDSFTNYQILRRQNVTQNIAQTFFDGASRDMFVQQVKRQYVTNNNTHAFTIDGDVVTSLQIAGLYLQHLGGTSYRFGVTDAQPVITVQGGEVVTL